MNSADEIWVPVYGYEGIYEVSSLGRVRSLKRIVRFGKSTRVVEGGVIRPILGSRGYFVVNFTANGSRKQHFLHKLVLESFVGPRPDGMDACHNNGNPLDCAIANLRWDTRSGNHKDKRKHGTWQVGERANNVKLTEAVVREIRQRKLLASEAQREFGLSRTNAKRIVSYKTWPHVHV